MYVTAHLEDIYLRTNLGVYDWEKTHKQPVLINVYVEYDADSAIKTDNINDTFNYLDLANNIVDRAENMTFELLESLLDMVLDMSLEHPRVQKATVKIAKTAALARIAKAVSLTASRSK